MMHVARFFVISIVFSSFPLFFETADRSIVKKNIQHFKGKKKGETKCSLKESA